MFTVHGRNEELCQLRKYHTMKMLGFEVVTAVSTNMAVLWFVTPCSLIDIYQRFRGPCCLHQQGDDQGVGSSFIALMMEAERTSETLVNIYHTTRRYNP
jgi:hypothetical protein